MKFYSRYRHAVMAFLMLSFMVGILNTCSLSTSGCKVKDRDIAESYIGECKNGLADGKGIARGRDVYEGFFKAGEQHGEGKYSWGEKSFSAGEIYEGDWLDGARTGQGKYTFADGSFYEGEFLNGRHNGVGKRISKDMVYEGSWLNDKRSGKGKCAYANGAIYEGDWLNDEFNGKGKLVYADGSIYEGEWLDGKFDGKGKYTTSEGDVYEGDFVDGEFTSLGKNSRRSKLIEVLRSIFKPVVRFFSRSQLHILRLTVKFPANAEPR